MKKNSSTHSAFINLRALVGFLLLSMGALLGLFALSVLTGRAAQAQNVQAPTSIDRSALRASAVFAKKLYEPLASQVFNLATSRAAAAQNRGSTQTTQSPDSSNQGPTLTTDREDYEPYSYVYFHGTGFEPGETVNMIVVELSPNPAAFEPWNVVADQNGEFDTSWYIFSEQFLGTKLQATATGKSSQVIATATFTDGNAVNGDGTASVLPHSVITGSANNAFTVSFRNETGDFNAGSSARVVVPIGWTSPQTLSPSSPGYVKATAVGSATVTSISTAGGGPYTVIVGFTATGGTANGFDLSYGGGGTQVTAPSTTGVYTFTTKSQQGSGGTPTAIGESPSIVVSPVILQRGSASTSAIVTSGTTITMNKPTGVVNGDVMIANIKTESGTFTQYPSLSGWTEIAHVDYENAGNHHRCALLYRIAGSSEPSSYTFSLGSGGTTEAEGGLVAFSGVDTLSGPFDVPPGTYSTGNKKSVVATAISTVTANDAVVMFMASQDVATTGAFSTTNPGILSHLYSNVAEAAWAAKTATGSTGNGTATLAGDKNWAAILLALKPQGSASQTITFDPIPDHTYGDADFGINPTASSGLPVSVSASGNCTLSSSTAPATVHITGAGPCSITASQSGNLTYQPATPVIRNFNIAKANATISVTPYSVAYDGNPHTATGTAKGVNNESLTGLDLSGTTHTNAGDYPSDPWTFTDSTGNYNNASGSVHDSIGKADATISVTPYSVTYDGNSHTATGTAKGANNETLSGLDLSGTTHTNAGDYPSDPWTFTDSTGNYKNTSGSVHDSIDKANATINVTPYSVAYDGNSHTATGTAKGAKNEDLTGLDLSGTKHTNAGDYPSDPWSFTDSTGNYKNTSGSVHDSIDKANATINVTPYSVAYDGNSHTATGTAKGANNETLSGLDLSGTTHTNAGDYPSDPWTFTDSTGNYKNTSGSVHDSIDKANATINVTPYSVAYDGNSHTATGTAKGVNNEDLTGLDLSGTTHTDAGDYPSDPWTFTDSTGNYKNTSGSVHDSIDKADATINVTPYSVPTYDAAAHTATGTAKGVNNEGLSGLDLSGTTHTNAGDYPSDPWTFTDISGNYKNTSGSVHDSIGKATATINVKGYKVFADGQPHTATGTAKGVNNEDVSSGLDLSGTTHTNPGDYPNDPWTFTSGNYNSDSGTVHDTILLTQVTVQANINGLSFSVDGTAYTTAQTFSWQAGSTHTIETIQYQGPGTDMRYYFSSWSDGGAISHTVTAPAAGNVVTYTAQFGTQYFLTINAGTGGGVNLGSSWRTAGTTLLLTANPGTGYTFFNWTGSGTGSYSGTSNPATIVMNGPITETATFEPNGTIAATVQTSLNGGTFTVDGASYSSPQSFFWVTGSSHTIATTTPQGNNIDTRYAWTNWTDGGAISHTVAPTKNTTYTANFTTQYFLTMNVGSGGKSVSPTSSWRTIGSAVSISATPSTGFSFSSWTGSGTGSFTGTNNPASVTMNGPITETASFTHN